MKERITKSLTKWDLVDFTEGSSSTSSREKEEDMFANVSADKALQFAVVLAEINRKYTTQNFKL